jgi:hypothetical protein
LDIPDYSRIVRQARQFGQVEEDESQHHHPIEDALDHNRRQRGRNRDPVASFEDHRSQYLTGACRVDIIPHVSDSGDGEQFAAGDFLQWRQQIVPAPGAQHDRQEVQPDPRDQPSILCRLQCLPECLQM